MNDERDERGEPAKPSANQESGTGSLPVQREHTEDTESRSSGDKPGRGEATLRATEDADRSDSGGIPEIIAAELPDEFAAEMAELSAAEYSPIVWKPVDDVIGEATAAICDQIKQCNDECNVDYQSCVACISGQISLAGQSVDAVIQKCIQKITKPIEATLTDIYVATFDTLGTPPAIEEVVAYIIGEAPPQQTNGVREAPPAPPEPAPPPVLSCPPGQYVSWNNLTNQYECKPICAPGLFWNPETKACQAHPPKPSGECKVELPDPCEMEPGNPALCPQPDDPCPKPQIECPPGQALWFDAATKTWKCTPNGQPPGQETQGKGDTTGVECRNWLSICDANNASEWDKTFNENAGNVPPIEKALGFDCSKPDVPPAWFPFATTRIGKTIWGIAAPIVCYEVKLGETLYCFIRNSKACNLAVFSYFVALRTLTGFLQQWFGLQLGGLDAAMKYEHSFSCPTGVPEPNEIDGMFVRDILDEKGHTNLRRVHNLCPEWSEKLRETIRTRHSIQDAWKLVLRGKWDDGQFSKHVRSMGYVRPGDGTDVKELLKLVHTADEEIRLWQRGIIKKDELETRLKKLGYTDDSTRTERLNLSFWYPGPSDLITLMTRDAFDDNIAAKYDYDSEFGKKFTEQAKAIADANGVPLEVMRLYWRAHWRNPSPEFMFRSFQRLRADSLDPQYRAEAITDKDVETFLRIDDMQPWWIPKYIAMTRNPMTLTDLRSSYDIGTLKEEEVQNGIKDLGYTDYAAGKIFEYWKIRKKQRRFNTSGGMTARKILTLFKNRVISRDEANVRLSFNGMPLPEIDPILDDAERERQWKEREQVMKAIRRRYRVGDYGPSDLIQALQDAGLTSENAVALANMWELEQQLRGKEASAAVLCKWRYRNMITQQEQWIRLVRVGWSQIDATRIVGACEADALLWGEKEFMFRLKSSDYIRKRGGKNGAASGNGKK